MERQGYRLQIIQQPGIVSAFHGKRQIASGNKINILRETRLGDCYYFPKDTISPDLLERSEFQTFCPFKGTATYWHLNTEDGKIENAAWSYENPLEDSLTIGGQISFGEQAVNHYETDKPPPLVDIQDENISSPLSDWILRQAPFCNTRREFIRMLGNKLVESGIAVYRLRVMLWSLHPQLAGAAFLWSRESDEVTLSEPGHDMFDNPGYINSPINLVSKGLGGVRQSLNGNASNFEFPIMDELKAEGATDYVAMPLRFSDGQYNCMTLTCDHKDGFTTENLGLIFECVGVISRFLEVMTLRYNTTTLLNTYLGERTAQKVLAGDIHRGQGENIEAVILFSDMRNSTGFAEQMPRDEYLALLNQYFETVLQPVKDNGGEVLKFIGDAVLAVFPITEDGSDKLSQTINALAAAKASIAKSAELNIENLDLGISLHIGDVTYGNVGGLERLDFTVIGPAVNFACRLEGLCKNTGERILISKEFKKELAKGDHPQLRSLGEHQFEGIRNAQDVFTIA